MNRDRFRELWSMREELPEGVSPEDFYEVWMGRAGIPPKRLYDSDHLAVMALHLVGCEDLGVDGLEEEEASEFMHKLRGTSRPTYTKMRGLVSSSFILDRQEDAEIEEAIWNAVAPRAEDRTVKNHESERVWIRALYRMRARLKYRATAEKWVERVIAVITAPGRAGRRLRNRWHDWRSSRKED